MKKTFYSIACLILSAPLMAKADRPATLENLEQVGRGSGFQQADIKLTIMAIVQALLGFVGIIFFVLILWGGAQWMMSGGNEQKIEAAKKRIISATIGLALIAMSYAIARTINIWLSGAV